MIALAYIGLFVVLLACIGIVVWAGLGVMWAAGVIDFHYTESEVQSS